MGTKKRILISGSIAYDYLMQYDGVFKDVLLKEHLDHLNVSFVAKNSVCEFGGCGPNIAYAMRLFDEDPIVYGVAGSDFDGYDKWLKKHRVDTSFIGRDEKNLTASAYIITDKNENQITIFSPGAMESYGCEKRLTRDDLKNVSYAILSPDVCERTVRLAHILKEASVPYFFDPGQMTPSFIIKDLRFLLKNAYGYIANHYEVNLLCERLNINVDNLSDKVDVFIETLGSKGLILRFNGDKIEIPAVKPQKVVDPTGCGDAFRGGFLAALNKGKNFKEACEKGSFAASKSIENKGTQSFHI